MVNTYGEDTNNWVYGQNEYKHVKIRHPLERVVNDSIYSLISLKSYPREEMDSLLVQLVLITINPQRKF